MNKNVQGHLTIACAAKEPLVLMRVPVKGDVLLSPDQARNIAKLLLERANEIEMRGAGTMTGRKRKQVSFKRDGFDRHYSWSYHVKYPDGTLWCTSGFKTKSSARKDYHKQKRTSLI